MARKEEKPAESTTGVVNFEELLARVENDWELLRDLAGIVREDFPRNEARLREAIAAKDMGRTSEAAHSLKGMLANLSASGGAAAASELEQMARSGKETELAEGLAKFEKETKGLLAELDAHLAGVHK